MFNKIMQKFSYIINILLLLLFTACSTNRHLDLVKSKKEVIRHIIHMGQSLGEGAQSLPLVTDYNTGFNNFRFSMGTHTWTYNMYPDTPELRADGNFLFVPLTAVQRNGLGETIANGMCDHLTQTLEKDFAEKNHFLFSYAGQGGKYIRELNKRHDEAKDPRAESRRTKGGYYITSIDDVRRAKKMADSLCMDYSVFAITWMQGEANGTRMYNRWDSVHTLQDAILTYKNDLIQLKSDYQEDIKTITGQKNVIPFFTYQTAGNLAGIAQLKSCDQEKDMYMVGPTYMLPNASNSYYHAGGRLVHGDGIHLTADGERWLGEQFGKVMRKVIVEKKSWQPLQPVGAWYEKKENAIYVRFNVPKPPLVIDTLFLPKQDEGFGFDIYNKSKTKYSIKNVEVVGNDLLKILMADFIPTKDSLLISYGLLPKVADVSQNIKAIRTGMKRSDGHDAIEIEFEGE
ncbi:MAG: hypothetical protein WCT77_05280, partial [Bacteroidota bacterium]